MSVQVVAGLLARSPALLLKARSFHVRAFAELRHIFQADIELAVINVTKPVKKRKLKQDPAHRLARQAYKYRSQDPSWKMKRRRASQKYRRLNKNALKRRSQFVRRTRSLQPR